jgi:hypothetical protein
MFLSARVLVAVSGVNSFEYSSEWLHRQLTADTLYIQLVDLEHNRGGDPKGIRYVPATLSTVTVTLGSIDSAKAVTRAASQPFAGDASIWAVAIAATDDFGEGNIEIALLDGGLAGTARKARITNGVVIESDDPGMC